MMPCNGSRGRVSDSSEKRQTETEVSEESVTSPTRDELIASTVSAEANKMKLSAMLTIDVELLNLKELIWKVTASPSMDIRNPPLINPLQLVKLLDSIVTDEVFPSTSI